MTRVGKNNSKSTVDHILTNSNEVTYKVNKEESVTDRFMIEIKCNDNATKVKRNEKRMTNCWKNYSKEKLCEMLKHLEFEKSNNINDEASTLVENLQKMINNLVKQKEIFVKKYKWFNSKISAMKREKDIAREKYCYINDEKDRENLMKKVKSYKEEIRNEKCNKIQKNIRENKNDPKKLENPEIVVFRRKK